MININLINWREKKRVIKNMRFFIISGVAVGCTLILCLIVYLIIGMLIARENSSIEYINKEMVAVEEQIKQIKDLQNQKNQLIDRRKIIDSLQTSRPFVVKLFDNIARAVPDGVLVKKITRKDNDLSIEGEADSNETISIMMINFQRLKWVLEAKLSEIKTVNTQDQNAAAGGRGQGGQANSGAQQIDAPIKSRISFTLTIRVNPDEAGG